MLKNIFAFSQQEDDTMFTYEVALAYGQHEFIKQVIKNVYNIDFEDHVYIFYDDEGETIFSAPYTSVVYIKKL